MRTYRGILPTLLGVAFALPHTNAHALPNQMSAFALSLASQAEATIGIEEFKYLPDSIGLQRPVINLAAHVSTVVEKRFIASRSIASIPKWERFAIALSDASPVTKSNEFNEGKQQEKWLATDLVTDVTDVRGVQYVTDVRDMEAIANAPSLPPTNEASATSVTTAANELAQNTPTLSLDERVRILTPQSGIIGDRATSLIVQYPATESVKVTVNGNPLDPETPTQIDRNSSQNLITQTWYNIRLKDGDNIITVQAGDSTPVELKLRVQNTAAKLEIFPSGDGRVRADGRSTVTIEGKITNSEGEFIDRDILVTLTASAGQFVGADADEDEPGFQVLARGGQFTAQLQSSLQAQPVQVRAAIEGISVQEENRIEVGGTRLEDSDTTPNTQFPIPPAPIPPTSPITHYPSLTRELEAYTQVEFITNLRPSIVSGYVNLRIGPGGTDYWGSFRDFLNPDRIDNGYEVDVNAALFATGPVGEWLFTGAFNSDRALNRNCEGDNRIFGGIQFCEQQYPVYGDSSTVDYLTPSKDSFYVRFERPARRTGAEPDYGMWGDYYTQEFSRASQLFTGTNRALHGFKANYNFGNLQVTALFSPDVEGFQRDTIAPNGTSGYYFLSRRLVIPGSESVFLETEELNRPGTVIERKPLNRGTDYEIDYDRGTLLFRRPIQATEFDLFANRTPGTGPLLVRRIVTTYQFEGGDDTNVYAGRAQYNFSRDFSNPSWIGATYWREDNGMRDFQLYGIDFLVSLGKNGQIVGEYARSNNDFLFRGNRSGSAYRLEITSAITDWLSGRGYYRSVDENFANNATVSFVPGQTRYGAQLAARITDTTLLEAQYDYEENFGFSTGLRDFPDLFEPGFEAPPGSRLDNSLTTISAGVRQRIGKADLSVSYVNRQREDRIGDLDGDASQIVSRLNVPITTAVTFRAQNELNVGDSDDLYPNRTTVGLDWATYPGVTLRLAHQFFDGGVFDRDSITSLDTIVERQLWKNTTLTSRYSIINGFNGISGQGALGVQSRVTILPGLRLLLGYERISEDILSGTGAGRRFRQPFAVGQSAASLGLEAGNAYSIGVEYTDNPDFKASARFEYRTGSSSGDNMVISAAAAGRVSRSITALARYQQANSSNQLLRGLEDTINLRLGFAYRDPDDDKFNALLRYEFRKNPATTPDTLLIGSSTDSTQHIFALEAIYAPNWRWEFYGKGAFRISSLDLARNFSNNTSTYLAQARATYRLGYRTDIAAEARWIGQPDSEYSEIGVAGEFGYYLTPDLRLGIGYSFGGVDDRDFSGYRSEGGPYFQLTFKVNELFGGFGRQRVVPRQQQENRVEPVATSMENTKEPLSFLFTNYPSPSANDQSVYYPPPIFEGLETWKFERIADTNNVQIIPLNHQQ